MQNDFVIHEKFGVKPFLSHQEKIYDNAIDNTNGQ